jgi:hypothetical protein
MKIFFLLRLLSMGQTYGSLRNVVHCDSSVFPYNSFNGVNTVLTLDVDSLPDLSSSHTEVLPFLK